MIAMVDGDLDRAGTCMEHGRSHRGLDLTTDGTGAYAFTLALERGSSKR